MAPTCYLYSEKAEAGRLLVVDKSELLHKPNKTNTQTKNPLSNRKRLAFSGYYFKDANLPKYLHY